MKNRLLLSGFLMSLVLSGCSSNPTLSSVSLSDFKPTSPDFNIIAPVGAPSMAYSLFAKDNFCNISTTPANVKAALLDPNTVNKAVIFDSVTGLKLLSTQADPQYKLARIITTGNLLVVATGHDLDKVMSDEDVIVSFGENNVPDTAFKLIYPGIIPDYYTNGVAQATAVLTAGQYEGSPVDYVVISEPYYTNVAANLTGASIYADVNQLYMDKALAEGYEVSGFPQAGLFIAKSLEEEESKEIVDKFLVSIDLVMNDLVAGASKTIAYLDKEFSMAEQLTYFGYNSITLDTMSEKGNKLAFNASKYDLSSFYSLMSQETPSDSLYSKYFLK